MWRYTVAVGLVLASPAAGQTVKAGIDAWGAGRHEQAVAIWRPLAAGGSADAAFNLAQAYKLGRGVPIDLAAAQRFYAQAAEAGHAEAQTSLGLLLFQNGSRSEAMRWLTTGAEAGEPRAMLVLGTALFNGDGLPRDPIRAYAYISRAAAQGMTPARSTLAEMDRLIPLDDRKAGVRLAQQWAEAKAPPVAAAARPGRFASAVVPKPVVGPTAAGGAFRIQLGAFRDEAAARALFARMSSRLGGAAMTLAPTGAVTRLQAGPYPTRAAAAAACASLRPQPCFAVPAS